MSEEKKKTFPWYLRFLEPYTPEKGQFIVHCSCGRVRWLKASKKVARHHHGHQMRAAQDVSFGWWLRWKLGLLDCRTWDEWIRDLAKGAGK